MGLHVYQTFYKMSYAQRQAKSFEEFAKSKYYGDFTKFGRYLMDINAVNPIAFVEFIIKMQIPLSKWRSPTIYETYLRELTKKETPEAAIERNFSLMQQWARDTGEEWFDFFRKVKPTLATMWIRSGRISPWVLYTAESAEEMFARMSDEQKVLVQQVIDPKFWETKFGGDMDTVSAITETLREAGL